MSARERRLLRAGVAVASSTLLMLLVINTDDSWAGDVIWRLSPQHGLHVGDIPVLLLWLAGVVASVSSLFDTRASGGAEASDGAGQPAAERPAVHD